MTTTQALRRLLREDGLIYMPVAYDALGGRLVQDTGFKAVYNGGFVTGGSRCASEPLLTMDEQVRVSGDVANAVAIPTVADGGAGFGEPLHTTRAVREFIRAGVAGIHIEDQLYPKRAHYHKYVAHAVPREEFVDPHATGIAGPRLERGKHEQRRDHRRDALRPPRRGTRFRVGRHDQ